MRLKRKSHVRCKMEGGREREVKKEESCKM